MRNTTGAPKELGARRRAAPLSPVCFTLLALLATASVLSGCGGTPGIAAAPSASAGGGSSNAAGPRMWFRDQGKLEPFENGSSVQDGRVEAEIFVSPFPPGRMANIDFFLTEDGRPVQSAVVTLQYDMTVMEHGPFRLLAVPTGRGHFLAPLDFAMDGDFWVNVSVDLGGSEHLINLLFRARR